MTLPVIIAIFPVEGKVVPIDVQNLPEYLVAYGEPGKVNLCNALEAIVRHLKYGSSYLPAPEAIQ